jgi:hypothetical protein
MLGTAVSPGLQPFSFVRAGTRGRGGGREILPTGPGSTARSRSRSCPKSWPATRSGRARTRVFDRRLLRQTFGEHQRARLAGDEGQSVVADGYVGQRSRASDHDPRGRKAGHIVAVSGLELAGIDSVDDERQPVLADGDGALGHDRARIDEDPISGRAGGVGAVSQEKPGVVVVPSARS